MQPPRLQLSLRPSNLATDPVCGMSVDPADARASTEYQGQRYYFCCPSCLAKFQADPERYLHPSPAAATPAPPPAPGTVYVCPMDPEVRQDHPAPARSAAWPSNPKRRPWTPAPTPSWRT